MYALLFVGGWAVLCAQPRVPLTVQRQRVIQTNGATIAATSPGSPFEMSGTAGLTVIGPTRTTARDQTYLGFWIPLKVVSTVPEDGGNGDDILAGSRVWAWPNPFSDVIQINIDYQNIDEASIEVYSIRGDLINAMKLLQLRQDGVLFQWNGLAADGTSVASGAYVLRIRLRDRVTQRRYNLSATINRVR